MRLLPDPATFRILPYAPATPRSMTSMETEKMSEDLQDSRDHKDVKLSYTIFPKDATAKEIYEFLIAGAEEDETAGEDVSGGTTKEDES